MAPRLITMLTHNDRTVKDALAYFNEAKDVKGALNWGFKDVGLPYEQMKDLVAEMKAAGKTTFMEVVTYTEDECKKAADLSVACGFDYLTGTIYYPSVMKILKDGGCKYLPFCGKVSGSPSVLSGSGDEIIAEAKELLTDGVDGFDLLAYRHDSEEPVSLSKRFISAVDAPVIIAGSINSFARLDIIKDLNPWGFTIGGAFFTRNFVPDGSYSDQLDAALRYLEK
ncbi:MAG TPA: hypothetical protein PLI10_01475 [Bacillota bacterium]|nr:hypothetical protein [Bacillota bacterium]HOH09576.1 hypothetical protein [Bacillota bacterium]HOS50075.1 hypothetical protein [Bacillota bacterium]HOY88290.1 hypothetical protein [Bacillota bacterium]HPI00859.1 hypothetical protein [Bacillota bacterium]